jgi:hypothetical protein
MTTQNKQTPWPELACELYRPSELRLSAKLVPTFEDRRELRIQSGGTPVAILGFVDRSRYFSLPSSSSVVLTRLIGPRSRPITSQKM